MELKKSMKKETPPNAGLVVAAHRTWSISFLAPKFLENFIRIPLIAMDKMSIPAIKIK